MVADKHEEEEEAPPARRRPNLPSQYPLSFPSRDVMAEDSAVAVDRGVCSCTDRWKGAVPVLGVIAAMIR
jgi:hypothetical protein